MTNATAPDFATVLTAETEHLDRSRSERAMPLSHGATVGLAFSGGGIRSATFCLGVLQSLARRNLLRDVDYLSTVSGGGYIGAWLAACQHHRGDAVTRDELASVDRDASPLQHLRRFSNYLTPRLGLTSIDFWTAIAIYLRNTLLNQSLLIALLVLGILLPWAVLAMQSCPTTATQCVPASRSGNVALYAAIGLLTAVGLWSVLNATRHARLRDGIGRAESPQSADWHAALAMALALVAGTALAFWLDSLADAAIGITDWVLRTGSIAFGFGLIAGLLVIHRMGWSRWSKRFWFAVSIVVVATSCGALLGVLLYAIAQLQSAVTTAFGWRWFVAGIGGPLVTVAIGISVVVFFGLMGRALGEWLREWQARFGAWLLVLAGVWGGAFVLVFVAPPVLTMLGTWASGGFATWFGTALGGALLGNARSTGDKSTGWRELLLKLIPFVFVVGLGCALAWLVFQALAILAAPEPALGLACIGEQSLLARMRCHDEVISQVGANDLILAAVPVLLLLAIGGSRFDVNLFSLHELYRNRLARCFIGASRTDRRPNPISGFDSDDDLPLPLLAHTPRRGGEPVPTRPLHLFNAALNLTRGEELAWQERMAASFWMTPLHAGYGVKGSPLPETIAAINLTDAAGDRVEAPFAAKLRIGGKMRTSAGLTLSTAMAISGAAASPNMGYHTSAPVAFLMAMFNLRLGWWLANPSKPRSWRRASPLFSAGYLVRELIGSADHRSGFVYLSDGGHFDNMGLYELVRRRVRYIVLVDAEEDREFSFGGLGESIRKCGIDFGARFDLDVATMRTATGGLTTQLARGTIHYRTNADDPPHLAKRASLLYIKSGLAPDDVLSADVRAYADANAAFPHESTADQWFSESQFESYRALGYAIAEKAFARAQTRGAQTLPQVLDQHLPPAYRRPIAR